MLPDENRVSGLKMLPIQRVNTGLTPRQTLALHFKSIGGELPIAGGWGYSIDDACVVEKGDHKANSGVPFDLVGLEYLFVEKRIYEEYIISRPEEQKFSGLSWKLIVQRTSKEAGRVYDSLIFEVSGFLDKDWYQLKAEYEGSAGFGSKYFDPIAHDERRRSKIITNRCEFWFDITSCHATT